MLMVGVLGTLAAGLDVIYWSVAFAAALVALVGISGHAGRLSRMFTPPVLAATLLLLALCLIPAALPAVFDTQTLGGPGGSFGFAMLLVLAMYWAERHLKGLWASAVVLLAMGLGSIIYYLLGLGSLPLLKFSSGSLLNIPVPDLGPPKFNFGVILSFSLCYLAVISNEIAADQAVGSMIGLKGMDKRLNRAVLFCGLGGVLGGLAGTPGPVTYSAGPAMLLSTKSASRFTLIPAGIMVVLLGLFPAGLALFQLMPAPVVGGVLLYLLAGSGIAGLEMLHSVDGGMDQRSGVVVGFAIMAGTVVTFMPSTALESLPGMLRPILGNGFVMGLIVAFSLEHLILKKRP